MWNGISTQIPANWPGSLLLRLKSPIFPLLQPNNPRRSGHFQLFSTGNVGLGKPVATDNHLTGILSAIYPESTHYSNI
ncbi:hypothetical protein [Yersinia alsatica]|uniref:hypothetical protein n=1 Tax=Yersinia alsatica TaxID=2890317 RepID=UPI0016439C95|nr:hypothetical protein [Yersinia alsatica]